MAKGKFNLASFLNADTESKNGENKGLKRIEQISVFDLEPSKDNFYSVKEIEDLKDAIELFGVLQSLTVKKIDGGKYRVIAGHKRRLASITLVEEGKKEYEFVPCGFENEEDPVKEKLILILTNSTTRQLTDWEKIKQAEELKKLLQQWKEKEKLPGRMRDIIADTLNTSSSTVARLEAISNNLSPEFKRAVEEGKVNISTAYKISGLPEEVQKEVYKKYQEDGSLTAKEVQKEKKQGKPKEISPPIMENPICQTCQMIQFYYENIVDVDIPEGLEKKIQCKICQITYEKGTGRVRGQITGQPMPLNYCPECGKSVEEIN